MTRSIDRIELDVNWLKRVHSSEYIDELESYSEPGMGYFDLDTFRSAGSFEASCEVTSSIVRAVEASLHEGPARSLVIGRPPGHHAERERPRGFCLVNHIAVAAEYALNEGGCDRVAVVDFDNHHGNGTQQAFYERDDVLYVSSHQYPFFPGSGSRDETGAGRGDGYTLNLPFPDGLDDRTILEAYESIVVDRVTEYAPDVMLVSGGFDGHRFDPLGYSELTGAAYYGIGRVLNRLADERCEGRLVTIIEGGYSPEGNREGLSNYLKGLND